MRAQHHVTIEAQVEPGKIERRVMRGMLAVERPDKLRLRALGPAGITLFEVVKRGADGAVVNTLKDPKGTALEKVIELLRADLDAVYRLAPLTDGSAHVIEGDAALYRATGREVRLTKFVNIGKHAVAEHIEIDVKEPLTYHVSIDASDIELDVPLDPALFKW
jgi:hypothetical protein